MMICLKAGWHSQMCRCCLSTNGTCNLTTPYLTEAGSKEVFSDLLYECFGITLSHLSEWSRSHLICDVCVTQLRNAFTFKKQVLQAEQYFADYVANKKDTPEVKLELQDYNELLDFEPNSDNDTNKETEQTSESVRKKQKTIKSKKRKRKQDDCDSDVPIAELTRKSNLENCVEFLKENESKDIENKVEIFDGGQNPPAYSKQISERKRIILTCETVLKYTTACPFRHHKSWFQCFYCTVEFMDISTLKTHISEHHKDIEMELRQMKRYPRSLQIDITSLTCKICAANLTDVDNMRRHFESAHSKVLYSDCIADYKVNSSPYFCHLCNQEFHVFRTLTTHLNEHYANCICDVCGRSFLNSKRLKVHKRNHEKGQFPCAECGKILKTKTSKANHMESAHSKRIIKCQICFKPMKHYNDRIKHMSEAHNITHMFKCHICFKEYNIKHYLATHMRQTHGNKNKKCVECGMAFITNHGLKKHMSKHTGLKPHKCEICGKAYARSYTLREHMRGHETDRQFL